MFLSCNTVLNNTPAKYLLNCLSDSIKILRSLYGGKSTLRHCYEKKIYIEQNNLFQMTCSMCMVMAYYEQIKDSSQFNMGLIFILNVCLLSSSLLDSSPLTSLSLKKGL